MTARQIRRILTRSQIERITTKLCRYIGFCSPLSVRYLELLYYHPIRSKKKMTMFTGIADVELNVFVVSKRNIYPKIP